MGESRKGSGLGRPKDGTHPNPMRYYPPTPDKQCKAKSRRTGLRCGKWALKGSDKCRTHGGRKRAVKMGTSKSFYSQRARGKFKVLLEQLADMPDDERHDLADEIDVMRVVAERAVGVFQKLCFKEEGGKPVEVGTKLAAIKLVQEALNNVGSLVDKSARLAAINENINPRQVQHIFDQLTLILKRHLDIDDESRETLKAILDDIDEIRLLTTEQSVSIIVG